LAETRAPAFDDRGLGQFVHWRISAAKRILKRPDDFGDHRIDFFVFEGLLGRFLEGQRDGDALLAFGDVAAFVEVEDLGIDDQLVGVFDLAADLS
jgi:hypothetical protein